MIDIDIVLFGRIVKSPKILTFMQIIEWTALRSLLNYECDSLINIDFTDDDNEKIPLVGSLMIGGECRQHTNTHCNWHETHRQVSVDNLTLEVHAPQCMTRLFTSFNKIIIRYCWSQLALLTRKVHKVKGNIRRCWWCFQCCYHVTKKYILNSGRQESHIFRKK